MKRSITATLTAAILFAPALMQAFSSGSPFFAFGWHGKITEEALEPLGFSSRVILQLKRANRHQDWDLAPVRILDTKRHFCRDKNQSHEEGFERNKVYLESERSRVLDLLARPDPRIRKARRILGWCLHTTQDAFSHSNYPQMSDADKLIFIQAVAGVGSDPPQGTILVCSGPDSGDSLSYGHVDHHKDDESSPEGSEAFWSSKTGAVHATREFVETTRRMLIETIGDEARAQEIWGKSTGVQ